MSELRANSDSRIADTCRMERLLDDLGWAALLIVTGIFWLIPEGRVPGGSWLIGVGTIILLFTIARMINRSPVSGFALAAGILALVAGIGGVLGLSLPLIPIALIVIGICIIFVRRTNRSDSSMTMDETCCR